MTGKHVWWSLIFLVSLIAYHLPGWSGAEFICRWNKALSSIGQGNFIHPWSNGKLFVFPILSLSSSSLCYSISDQFTSARAEKRAQAAGAEDRVVRCFCGNFWYLATEHSSTIEKGYRLITWSCQPLSGGRCCCCFTQLDTLTWQGHGGPRCQAATNTHCRMTRRLKKKKKMPTIVRQ